MTPRGEMPFLDHLEELRWRILWSLVAILVGTILGWWLLDKIDIIEVLKRPIAPYLPGGRLVFHLFGVLGQFERDLIGEHTRAGLVAAEARGCKGGRKPVVTSEKLERVRVIIGKGLTVREGATRLRVGKTALYEALRG